MEVWNKAAKYRMREKKTYKRHTQKIRDIINQACKEFTFENELVQECVVLFDNMQEELSKLFKEERCTNNFLKGLNHDVNKYEIGDLDRVVDTIERAFQTDFKVLQDFDSLVKSELVMDKFYFSF